eukprot:746640-Hanusia_phi.AAC.3
MDPEQQSETMRFFPVRERPRVQGTGKGSGVDHCETERLGLLLLDARNSLNLKAIGVYLGKNSLNFEPTRASSNIKTSKLFQDPPSNK